MKKRAIRPGAELTPAVFLDKDDTLIEDIAYNVDPDLIRFKTGAAEGLKELHAAGYRLIVVSNQSGVARGYFPEQALLLVERRLRELLAEVGVTLAGFYYCPHHPEGMIPGYTMMCSCRKPAPGLIFQAATEHRIDLARSWLIGDKPEDVEAGRRAGCRTVMIDSSAVNTRDSLRATPDYVVCDLAAAARVIRAANRENRAV